MKKLHLLLGLIATNASLVAMDQEHKQKHTAQELQEIHVSTCVPKTISLEDIAQLPTDSCTEIFKFADGGKERLIARNMEKLLPALVVFPTSDHRNSIFDIITKAKQENTESRVYLISKGQMPPDDRLYFHGSLTYNTQCSGGNPKESLIVPIPANTRPPLEMETNEVCALFYTNGTTLFKVHDQLRFKLQNLSLEQLKCLIYLYDQHTGNSENGEIDMSEDRLSTAINELPREIHSNINTNYLSDQPTNPAIKRKQFLITCGLIVALVTSLIISNSLGH